MFFDCAAALYKVAGGGCPLGNIMPASSFSYDGVHVFLTYPQCPLEREQLRDFLLHLAPDCAYIIGRELHDDGNYHLHAYVHFGGRRRFTSSAAFDVEGYHPNIQKPRRRDDCIAYCRKEDLEPLVSDNLRDVQKSTNGWGDLLQVCETREQFLEGARERFPRDYVLGLERLLFFCEWRFGRESTEYSGRGRAEFREPVSLTEWVRVNLLTVCRYPLMPIGFYSVLPTGGPQSPPLALLTH